MTRPERRDVVVAYCTTAAFFLLHVVPERTFSEVWMVIVAGLGYTFILGPFCGLLAVAGWDALLERVGGRQPVAVALMLVAALAIGAFQWSMSAGDQRIAIKSCREAAKENRDNPTLCQYREVWSAYLPEPDYDDGEY